MNFFHMQVKNTPRIACLKQVNINRSVIIEKSKRRDVATINNDYSLILICIHKARISLTISEEKVQWLIPLLIYRSG